MFWKTVVSVIMFHMLVLLGWVACTQARSSDGSLATPAQPNLPGYEIASLQALYNATDGDHWNWHNSTVSNGIPWVFTPTCNPCAENWQGVNCSSGPSSGFVHVTELYLGAHGLRGQLPVALGNLSHLIMLELILNQLTGTIPAEIGNLQEMERLYLYFNYLTGTIPAEIGNLLALKQLGLYINYLTGTIPAEIGSLLAMEELALYSNHLTGTIPAEISNLQYMKYLELNFNHLTGSIPADIGNLLYLEQLYLDNNYLAGSIPTEIGNLQSMQVLDLYSNYMTSTIPVQLGSSTLLQYLFLDENYLTGTIPVQITDLQLLVEFHAGNQYLHGTIPDSIGNMTTLSVLSLGYNLLSSTVPHSLQQLLALASLFINNNNLEGFILQFINSSTQRGLSTVQINGNAFTGNIPDDLFALPQLRTVVLGANCFTGTLPTAMCGAQHLTTLSMDGLHSGAACRVKILPGVLQAYELIHSVRSGIPTCLIQMRTLNTLHLSGNGLTGALPEDASISANLVDLALSHNQLTGTIPRIFQQRIWYNLDLSYNKLTGTLSGDFATVPGNLSVLSELGVTLINGTDEYSNPYGAVTLRNNRLSNTVPSAVDNMLNVSVLSGNLFDCALDRQDLPQHDGGLATYTCGSSAFNTPYFVCLGLIVLAVGAAATVYKLPYRWVPRDIFPTISTWLLVCDWYGQHAPQEVNRLRRYKYVVLLLDEICKIAAWGTLYIVTVMAPLYALLSHYYGTHTYTYAWTVSAAYLSGPTSLALMLVFFCALLTLLLWLMLAAAASKPLSSFSGSSVTARVTGIDAAFSRSDWLLPLAIGLLTFTMNTAVVVAANVGYVLAALYSSKAEQGLAQVALSLFKLLWGNFGLVLLFRWARQRLSHSVAGIQGDGKARNFFVLQLSMQVFNLIVVPCAVVAALSPDCFSDAIEASTAVNTHFTYQECSTIAASGCYEYDSAVATSNFQPPFTYSYQCSSSLVTTYAPTFVYMGLFATFISPLLSVTKRYLYQQVPQESKWKAMIRLLVPRILRPSAVTFVLFDKPYNPMHPYWDANHFTVILISYLGVLLTFGLVFPPLALVMLVTICSTVYLSRMEVGRFLSEAIADNVHKYSDIIDVECEGVGSVAQLQQAARVLGFVMCGFYALFLFDTLGDAQGARRAAWVLVVVPLFPALVLVGTWSIKALRGGQSGPGDVGEGVELQSATDIAAVDASVGTMGLQANNEAAVFNVLQEGVAQNVQPVYKV